MASGDQQTATVVPAGGLPLGAAITASGRISATRRAESPAANPPFTRQELIALDEALIRATRDTGARFSVYIGDLGDDAFASASEVLKNCPEPAYAALIAVSPNSRDIVVVTGHEVEHKLGDKVAQLGVTAAIPPFQQGQLVDGLIAALRVMSSAVKPPTA
ncbi:DUF5130 family protein [Tsukamurella sp. 8F]|uniref:DUF5130 family protein n=1 Tax=unclassified Tsukamurella TaxID=2633480 RepID=UPI0023B9B836|nr:MULTISPECIES: DUF5130 family protein [unclassified Tsukamurella]MDF0529673.1 DUF5130 family protein [Tsukamurella sp. 8J]MDF0585958.1 DUF5130 family protein [Tsukamurella sp. 8F]